MASSQAPVQPGSATKPPATRVTRDQLVALGRSGNPWAFVPMGVQAVRLQPTDHELRFLLAAAYAKLGLRTSALELLKALAIDLGAHDGIEQLLNVVQSLPSDAISLADRQSVLFANLRALTQRTADPIDLISNVEAWVERTSRERLFRTVDGNLIRQDASGAWVRFANERASADALFKEHTAAASQGIRKPVYFQGIDPPWLLRLIADQAPGANLGELEALVIVCPDVDAFLDALALIDLSDVLAHQRTRLFIGPNCGEDFAAHLRRSIDFGISGAVYATPALGNKVIAEGCVGTASILNEVADEQAAELRALRARVATNYDGRDVAWWADRFAGITGGTAPARILIPTSRLSTFVQHSAHDFADALRNLGCDVRMLIEPDDHTRLSSVAFARPFADWQPDVVVSIGHTRAMLSNILPTNVPLVTWMQDRCTDFFRTDAGRSVGTLDLLVGFPYSELFESFGYPPDQVLPTPVLVSETKFHTGPIDPALRKRLTCDMAFVSHHAETPAQLVDRILATLPPEQQHVSRTIMQSMLQAFEALLVRGLETPLNASIDGICADICAQTLGRRDAETVSMVSAGYGYPLAERIYRHQMIAWAADICERRGWRLHLYGNGWDKHDRFAQYAQGALQHDEELRAAYQCAAVNLHAGLGSMHHQRIMECALSGGCTLTRIKHEDARLLEWWAQNDIASEPDSTSEPDPYRAVNNWRFTPIADHWQSMMVHALYARLGMPPQHTRDGWQVLSPEQIEQPWHDRHGAPLTFRGAWLIGDPSESGFWSSATLERAADAFISDTERRAHLSAWQRSASLESFSYAKFARAMLDKLASCIQTAADRG
ncbi:MAG: hypothetical protein KDA20_00325 [Phycisphaerales bacterium]|nr:hypothetical protein [Phycisphaerales bacterium]